MYLCLSQGYFAVGDAYTRCYDDTIKDISQRVKIVDDTLLYDYSNEEFFTHWITSQHVLKMALLSVRKTSRSVETL